MRAGLLALLAGLLLAACNPPVDYGQVCRLTRPTQADGGGLEYIPADDPALADADFDFLSNGDTDCEDLVCVRQHGKDFRSNDEDGMAHGICSTPCIGDSDCGDQASGLVCHQLAFDQAFLDQLRENDPATYEEYFGDSSSPNYCINPNLPDLP